MNDANNTNNDLIKIVTTPEQYTAPIFLPNRETAYTVICNAASACYKTEPKNTTSAQAALIRKLIQLGHESVLEHVSCTFKLLTDRGVTHELVRHRLASYTQESTRYCDYNDEKITFIEPPRLTDKTFDEWKRACEQAALHYKVMREYGASPQIARSVLPNSLAATIYITANLREWRHICKLRCAENAHPQIRSLMKSVRQVLWLEYPAIFEDLTNKKVTEK
jgi:thymidylate synthase (FAD)